MRRDDPDAFPLRPEAPLRWPAAAVVRALRPLVTDARYERLAAVVAGRTRRVLPILEDLDDPHNGAAVLRSAEAFGVQDVYLVRSDGEFLASRTVAKGAHRWLDVHFFTSIADAIAEAKRRGFRVLVAEMGGTVGPRALAEAPTAVIFGNEHRGASARARELADGAYAIPMRGFVESLNVSVAAAVTLFAATDGMAPSLTNGEREELLARYLLGSVRDSERVVEESLASG